MSRPTWINFEPTDQLPERRTARYVVRANGSGIFLGTVKWYAPWRRYSFFPEPETIFEHECLRAIAEFCEQATRARGEERKREREAEYALARSVK